jgi:ferredoxin
MIELHWIKEHCHDCGACSTHWPHLLEMLDAPRIVERREVTQAYLVVRGCKHDALVLEDMEVWP